MMNSLESHAHPQFIMSIGQDSTTLKHQLKYVSRHSLQLASSMLNYSELKREVVSLREELEKSKKKIRQLAEQNIKMANEKSELIKKKTEGEEARVNLSSKNEQLKGEISRLNQVLQNFSKIRLQQGQTHQQLKHLSKQCLILSYQSFQKQNCVQSLQEKEEIIKKLKVDNEMLKERLKSLEVYLNDFQVRVKNKNKQINELNQNLIELQQKNWELTMAVNEKSYR